jgi:localization factor PodJL
MDGFGAQHAEAFSAPAFDPAASFSNEQHFNGVQAFDTMLGNGFDAHGMNGSAFAAIPSGATAESYIAATRRNARAAAAEAQVAPASSGFSWGAPAKTQPSGGGRSRAALLGAVALVAIAALGGGYVYLRSAAHAPHAVQPAAATLPVAPQGTPALTGSGVPQASESQSGTPSPDQPAAEPRTQTTAPAPVQAQTNLQPAPAAASERVAAVSPMDKLVSAAKAGSPIAETVLGLKYVDGDGVAPNEAEGGRWLERAAKQGQPIAEYRLATLYERGHGVPADPKLAATWYEAAAKLGNRKAMHNLAVAYAQGAGVAKNFTAAAQWFENAAELGLRDSQFNLAVLYERGLGVPQDLSAAYKWYAIAASQGDSESKARVTALATQLKPEERAAAEHAAATFKPAPLNQTANVAPTAADF